MPLKQNKSRAKQDYDDVYEAGKQAECDTFWDTFQDNGNRRDYDFGFGGVGWDNTTFKPKYPIIAVGGASYIFTNCSFTDFDFVDRGVVLDFSSATSLTYAFRKSKGIKRLGTIDCSSCKELNRTFYECGAETIDNLIVHENLKYTSVFDYASNLVNLTVNGIIAQNGFNISSAKSLSFESVESIINALSTTTSGLTVTLSRDAVNKAFETSEGANDGSTSAEWLALVATRQNWTIALA